MVLPPPGSTRTDTLFPCTTLFQPPAATARPAAGRGLAGTLRPGMVAHHGSQRRSEEHTSELQSLMRISYAVFCLKKKTTNVNDTHVSHLHPCAHSTSFMLLIHIRTPRPTPTLMPLIYLLFTL